MAAPSAARRKPGVFTFAQAVNGDTTLDTPANAIYVGGAGTLTIYMDGDNDPVTVVLPAGKTLRARVRRIIPTGSPTATGVVAFW